MKVRLGVNIDHVATLRQQRGEEYPSVVEAARICLREGADQITIHLREDRRHIQDTDVDAVRLVTREFGGGHLLNLEMGCNDDITKVAIASKPDWVCLVPENREEKTTEGGLNLLDAAIYEKVKDTCRKLRQGVLDIKISLFLEPSLAVLQHAQSLPVDAVEIHTGGYARSFLNNENLNPFFLQFEEAKNFLQQHSLGCHAGHGLTLDSTKMLLSKGYFEEYNIGHWIICEAVFSGLRYVVSNLRQTFDQ
ncbi:MAG: pyridoxine 5'-phosphate synthase [Oligoflexia bacterium]|nr:pyridoxine 5'-phosphate synthase [Oligoflexia bacterium]